MFSSYPGLLIGKHRLIGIGGALVLLLPVPAEAQFVRRFGGGGVQINAPLVRVNVGPAGGTSVRAPFTALDSPGRLFLGRRRRLLAQPQPQQNGGPRRPASLQDRTKQPTPADVDTLPYPTASQLAAMDDASVVETLREMMGRLNYRLSLLNTGEGWQSYLVLSRELLGSPGAPPETAQWQAIQKVLPRYDSIRDDLQFAKISTLPSFVAAQAALEEVNRRFAMSRISNSNAQISGPVTTDRSSGETTPIEESSDQASEILPTPEPAELPNATRGERSILRRK